MQESSGGNSNRAMYEPGQSSVHPTPRKKAKKHASSDSSADPSRSHEKVPSSEGVKNTGSKKTVKPKPEEPFKGVLLPKKVDDKKTEEKKSDEKKVDEKKTEEKKEEKKTEEKKETKVKVTDSTDDPLAKLIGGRRKKGEKIDPDRPYYKDDEPEEEEEYKKKEETPDKKYKKEEKKSSKHDKYEKYSKQEKEEEEEDEEEDYGKEEILPVNEDDIVELWGRK